MMLAGCLLLHCSAARDHHLCGAKNPNETHQFYGMMMARSAAGHQPLSWVVVVKADDDELAWSFIAKIKRFFRYFFLSSIALATQHKECKITM